MALLKGANWLGGNPAFAPVQVQSALTRRTLAAACARGSNQRHQNHLLFSSTNSWSFGSVAGRRLCDSVFERRPVERWKDDGVYMCIYVSVSWVGTRRAFHELSESRRMRGRDPSGMHAKNRELVEETGARVS